MDQRDEDDEDATKIEIAAARVVESEAAITTNKVVVEVNAGPQRLVLSDAEWEGVAQHYMVAAVDLKRTVKDDPGGDGWPTEVAEGLFVGNQVAAATRRVLDGIGVTHVVDMAAQCDPRFPDDFSYLWIKIYDHERESKNLRRQLDRILQFIDDALVEGGRVLLHCQSGVSRSVTVAIAYLIRFRSLAYDAAYAQVRTARPIARPIPAFRQLLVDLEKEKL
jgi:hypothetical protein